MMVGFLIIYDYTGGPYDVAIHGDYLAAKTNWEIVIAALDGHGEVLDMEESSYETCWDESEQDLIDIKANCDKLYVVGFSMGGMIAAYLAANYDVDKLVLLSTARKYVSFKYLSAYIADAVGDGFKGKLD